MCLQTVSALGSFFLAMVLYPEVQLKAQTQIDAVCMGRLPSFSDFGSLPYVDAICKEALRWHPVVPLGMQVHVLDRKTSTDACGWNT